MNYLLAFLVFFFSSSSSSASAFVPAFDFDLTYVLSGGFPMPPSEDGGTCDEIHILQIKPNLATLIAKCSSSSLKNSEKILYTKTKILNGDNISQLLALVDFHDVSTVFPMKPLQKQVPDDLHVSLRILNLGVAWGVEASRLNSDLPSTLSELFDQLDNLSDSFF